jgi:hypothetical protein
MKVLAFDVQAVEARRGMDKVLEILHLGPASAKAEHREAREEEGGAAAPWQ